MKNLFLYFLTITWSSTYAQLDGARVFPANDPAICYTGRYEIGSRGEVSFDWVGTYFSFEFSGETCHIRASDSDTSYYNVFLNDSLIHILTISSRDTLLCIAKDLDINGRYRVRLQKRSEGEFGRTTINNVQLSPKGQLYRPFLRKQRFIEFIGDSHTVGYGTDGKHRDEPFAIETENPDKTYAAILSRYFDADYALIAHSGKGVVRNYGDSVTAS